MRLMQFSVSLSLIVIGISGCAYSPRVTYEPTLIEKTTPNVSASTIASSNTGLNTAQPVSQKSDKMSSGNWSVVTDPVVLDINEEIPEANSTASITNYNPNTYVNYYSDAPYLYPDADEFAAISLSSTDYNTRYYDSQAYYPRSTASFSYSPYSYSPYSTYWYYDDWDNRNNWYEQPYYPTYSYYSPYPYSSPYPYYAYSRGYNPWRSYGYSMVVYDGSARYSGFYAGHSAMYSPYSPLDYYNPYWSYDYYNDWGYSSPYLSHSGYPYYAYYPYGRSYFGYSYWGDYNKPKEENKDNKREKRPANSPRREEIRISSQGSNGSHIIGQPNTVLSKGSTNYRAKSNSRSNKPNSSKRQTQQNIKRNTQMGYSYWAPVSNQQSRDALQNSNYTRTDRVGRTLRTSRDQGTTEANNGTSTLVQESQRSDQDGWSSASPTSRVSTWRRPRTSGSENITRPSQNPIVISPSERQSNGQIKVIAPRTYNRYEPSRSTSSAQAPVGVMSRSTQPARSYSNSAIKPARSSLSRPSYSAPTGQSSIGSPSYRSSSTISPNRSSAPSSSNRSAYTYTSNSSRRSPSATYTPPRSTPSRSISAPRSPSNSSSRSRSYSSPAPRSAPASSPSVNRSSPRSAAPSRSTSPSRSR